MLISDSGTSATSRARRVARVASRAAFFNKHRHHISAIGQTARGLQRTALRHWPLAEISAMNYLKGAAAPPAAGPFNSTLHTGDSIWGLNDFVFCFITYAIARGPVEHGLPVANLFLALRTFCLAQ